MTEHDEFNALVGSATRDPFSALDKLDVDGYTIEQCHELWCMYVAVYQRLYPNASIHVNGQRASDHTERVHGFR